LGIFVKVLPGIIGIGDLGSYGVQYVKILGGGSTVIAMDRKDEKIELAKSYGADHSVNIKNDVDIKKQIMDITADKGVDIVIDCVGAESTASNSVKIIGKGWQL
jgi:propanol-preferring alcohol dehydrogenase